MKRLPQNTLIPRWLFSVLAASLLLGIHATGYAEISTVPLFLTTAVKPNLIMIIDDSGSMDSEVLLPTNDGALWWNTSDKRFSGTDGTLNFNAVGTASSTWKKYVYLFPNGTGTGNRAYGDSTNDHYAIPPFPQYAFARCPSYNGMYYDYTQTYEPWISEGGYTFTAIPATSASSDPVRGTGVFNLTLEIEKKDDNWKFYLQKDMVIPKGTYYYYKSWIEAATDVKVEWGASYGIKYFPAVYYEKTTSGKYLLNGNPVLCSVSSPSNYQTFASAPSAFSSTDVDALAPDGACLKKYEIKSGATFPSKRTYEKELENFANWFGYMRKRHLALRAGAGEAFDDVTQTRLGGFRINNRSLQGMWDIDTAAGKTDFYHFLYNAVGSGGTPNRDALGYAGGQFDTNTGVITERCQQNFALLFTDGFSTITGPNVGNTDGSKGSPYADGYSDTIADIAMKYYSTRLRSDLAAGDVPVSPLCGSRNAPEWVDCNKNLHMVTYGITLGAKGHQFGVTHFSTEDAYEKPPVWGSPQLERNPVQVDDLYHATVNGRGEMLNANNAVELGQSLKDALQSILERRVSSAAAIATNSTRLVDTTLVYQARFDSSDWSGQILAYGLNSDGSVGDIEWNTDEAGKIPAHGSRNIYTWYQEALEVEGEVTLVKNGVEFSWANLSAAQKSALYDVDLEETETQGIDRLAWLRGDQSKEDGIKLRIRSRILGDIVNSDPVVVGAADFGYEKLPVGTPGQDNYKDFLTTNKSRAKVLYIGGNDGMLHAFNALTGEEMFAYVPFGVYDNLAALTSPGYVHRYYVDGSPYFGDAYNATAGVWKTVLVGALGGGGRGIFALDITDPEEFSAQNVMWEFTDADLGHVMGPVMVVRLQDGQWAAVFGNGYQSDSNKAFLYIVNLWTGALITKIDTGAGTMADPNGLAVPALLPDSGRTILYAYAGDLHGNLWKFDLSDKTSTAKWGIAYKSGSTPVPLFQARGPSSEVQPITAQLQIGTHPTQKDSYMIFFGTGKYFETGDNAVETGAPVQSFYGIGDIGKAITKTDRSTLVKQEITYEGKLLEDSDFLFRVTSENSTGGTDGWYMDLIPPGEAATPQGERVVSEPLLRHGRIIFATLIPLLSDPCAAGGISWLMELDAATGKRLTYSAFDANNDKSINSSDRVTVQVDGKDVLVDASGLQSSVGIIKTPAVITAGDGLEFKYSGGSDGGISVVREKGADDTSKLGRRSWRQIN